MATATEPTKMNLYEGMFLVDTNKFASDPEGITKSILGVLEKSGAEVVIHRPWLDGKLAYQIDRYRKGLHYLTYFKMPSAGMAVLTRACKLNDLIIRHMVIRHPQTLFDASVAALTPAEEPAEPAEPPKTEPAKTEPAAKSEPVAAETAAEPKSEASE